MFKSGEKVSRISSRGEDRIINDFLVQSEMSPARYALYVTDRIRNAEYAEWSAEFSRHTYPDFSQGIRSSSAILKGAIMKSPTEIKAYSLRAKAAIATIDEFYYAPVLFMHRDMFVEEREDLLKDNAQYERLGAVVADTIHILDSHIESSRSQQHIRGFLQEVTVAALLNRANGQPDSTHLGLLAALEDDNFNKVDVELYSFSDEGVGDVLPIQIKSSDYGEDPSTITPEGGILLFAKDYYNERLSGFIVSRLIAEEVSGAARPEVSSLLDRIQEKLLTTIAERSTPIAA